MSSDYEVPKGAVILGGKSWPCHTTVKTWKEHGLEFSKSGPGARPRRDNITKGILHFTGGENSMPGMFGVLRTRRLGIEFGISREGEIWQFCDPAVVDTFDAGIYNGASWGVEVMCCGVAPLPARARNRKTYEAKVNGHSFTFASFYPAQMKALVDLCNTMAAALKIPKQFPAKAGLLKESDAQRFCGFMGHYHISAIKPDPGTEPFEVLQQHGYKPVDFDA